MVKVCVTGASGYIALHLVQQLLDAGHSVNGTVRDMADEEKTAPILALAGAADRLNLFAADLQAPEGSFDKAVSDCEFVFHVASPCLMESPDPMNQIIKPATNGVKSVLHSCVNAGPGLKRFILTSSMAAITDEAIDGYIFTEKDFNTKSSITRNPYSASKYQAEKLAHDFMASEKRSFELIVINPFVVLGPALSKFPGLAAVHICDTWLNGKAPFQLPFYLGVVDVRDVAKAHVLAMTKGEPGQRYICAGDNVPHSAVMNYLIELGYSQEKGYKVPTKLAGTFMVNALKLLAYVPGLTSKYDGWFILLQLGKALTYDNSKIKEAFGMDFRPWKETVFDNLAASHIMGNVEHAPVTK